MSQIAVRSARPLPLGRLLSPPALVSDLWRYRDLITQFALRDFSMRHKGTLLGLAWTVISPLLNLAIYTFLFTVIFPSKWRQMGIEGVHTEFAITFFCGFVVYNIFQECAVKAPSTVLDRPNLVRKVVFPLEILPVANLISSLIFGSVGILLTVAAAYYATRTFSTTIYYFPLVLIPLSAFALGLGWLIAALGVFIRDTRQVVPVIMQLLFFMTPIFYPVEQVPEDFRPVLYANPLTAIVENARRTLIWDMPPDWASLGIVTLIGLATMQIGYASFMRAKRGFADVI